MKGLIGGLVLSVLSAGCASPHYVADDPPEPEPLARQVLGVYQPRFAEALRAVGLNEDELHVQRAYLGAQRAGAVRHEAPEARDWSAARAATRTAYRALSDMARTALTDDLREGRPAAFRLRCQELFPFARVELNDMASDYVALGQPTRRSAVDGLKSGLWFRVPDDWRSHRLEERLSSVGPQELLENDELFEAILEGLGAACYRMEEGTPAADTLFTDELRRLRRRWQLRRDHVDGWRAVSNALRAEAAATQAEGFRDTSLDAALDARLAAEAARDDSREAQR